MVVVFNQGWEFAHRFSERIARFLQNKLANERLAQKKVIRSFAHFCEQPEQFAHIAHFW